MMTAGELREVLRAVADAARELRGCGVTAVRVGEVEIRLDGPVAVGVDAPALAEEDAAEDDDERAARRYRDQIPGHAI